MAAARTIRTPTATRMRRIRRMMPAAATDRTRYVRPVEDLLLAWFREHGRDLPWRRTRDPYAILVSEVMAQQTQVERVIPRWQRWLERWRAHRLPKSSGSGKALATTAARSHSTGRRSRSLRTGGPRT